MSDNEVDNRDKPVTVVLTAIGAIITLLSFCFPDLSATCRIYLFLIGFSVILVTLLFYVGVDIKLIVVIGIILVGSICILFFQGLDSSSNDQNTWEQNNTSSPESVPESQNTETITQNKESPKPKPNPPEPDTGGSAMIYIILFNSK